MQTMTLMQLASQEEATNARPFHINIAELMLVRSQLLPPVAVALASIEELKRRKVEIDRAHPNLQDETGWVLHDEQQRRKQAFLPLLQVSS